MVNLTRWSRRRDPDNVGLAPTFRSGIDRLFQNLFESPVWGEEGQSMAWFPSLEVSDTHNELVINAEVPGLKPDEIDVTVTGNQLVISGEKRDQNEQRREGFYRSERRYGYFRRVIELPQDVDADNIDARYNNGVLELHIPKTEGSQPRRISVKSGGSQAGRPAADPSRGSTSGGSSGESGSNRGMSSPRTGGSGSVGSTTSRPSSSQASAKSNRNDRSAGSV